MSERTDREWTARRYAAARATSPRPAGSAGVDEYAKSRPAGPLRPFVAFYSGYRQAGVAPARHRGLPSPYLTLIFTLDDPLEVAAHPDPRQPPGRYDALIGGLHLTPALITHPGRQSGVQVALRPLGCRALFGVPAAELAFADEQAADVLGALLVDEVRGRLRAAADWPSRFAALDGVLLRHLRPDRFEAAPEIVYACRRLLDEPSPIAAVTASPIAAVAASSIAAVTASSMAAVAASPVPAVTASPVAAVAAEVGWSARYLTDRFRAEVGLRPKEAARVARFDRARRQLTSATRMADLAAAHGFSDQSHLVREFHAFAGCTPTGWLAAEAGLIEGLHES